MSGISGATGCRDRTATAQGRPRDKFVSSWQVRSHLERTDGLHSPSGMETCPSVTWEPAAKSRKMRTTHSAGRSLCTSKGHAVTGADVRKVRSCGAPSSTKLMCNGRRCWQAAFFRSGEYTDPKSTQNRPCPQTPNPKHINLVARASAP